MWIKKMYFCQTFEKVFDRQDEIEILGDDKTLPIQNMSMDENVIYE